ncbi:hypothetical protein F4604DRAFT_1568919 [Suillus subluteus]|nr:hypothetical protein F4604DRAFT_1568919 [Suillus subluteus]
MTAARANPTTVAGTTHTSVLPTTTTTTGPPQHTVTCRFGGACTRPNCPYTHPPKTDHFGQQFRFGAGCTYTSCPFQHPEGRVLPSTFHCGLSTTERWVLRVLQTECSSLSDVIDFNLFHLLALWSQQRPSSFPNRSSTRSPHLHVSSYDPLMMQYV